MPKKLDPLTYVTLSEIEDAEPCEEGYTQFLNYFKLRPGRRKEREIQVQCEWDTDHPKLKTTHLPRSNQSAPILLTTIAKHRTLGTFWISWLLANVDKFKELHEEVLISGATGNREAWEAIGKKITELTELQTKLAPQRRLAQDCYRDFTFELRRKK